MTLSTRAHILTRRTYNRPLNSEATQFEDWEQTVSRVIEHQSWLWSRQLDRALEPHELVELSELKQLILERKIAPAGRTLWLGGTPLSREREVSQFNCSHLKIRTVHDVVDAFWLLLNGAGVGFWPEPGILNGFTRHIPDIEIIRSSRKGKGGRETNLESWDPEYGTWYISIGDSGEAWAKAIGKILAGKYPAQRLVLDLSEIREAGVRLSRYGWISSGDEVLAATLPKICALLNRRADQLLDKLDILDLLNFLGEIQTGRRGAEIALCEYGSSQWREFATAKANWWEKGLSHRCQSNNSLVFFHKPSRDELEEIFEMMAESGGSEPGIINAEAARRRAPWFEGVNPCAEILLGDKSFCNLSEVDISKFKDDPQALRRAVYLVARMNYRQTLVNLDDGVLQRAWHENNEYLRLCGVGLTGIVCREDMTPYDFKVLRNLAVAGAYSMASELGTPIPKNVTTIKPSGTVSKIMDTTEGVHRPLGRYIFNNVTFSKHDPLVPALQAANYKVFDNPAQKDGVCVTFPIEWSDVEFHKVKGRYVNLEPAIEQLERYKMLMESYVEHNCSITVSYDLEEVPDIIDWLEKNWDSYVGVSFIYRTDPTKTAKDLGYLYLPQEVVTKEKYEAYVNQLKPVELDHFNSLETILDDECATGACPVR